MKNLLKNDVAKNTLSIVYIVSLIVLIIDYGFALPKWLEYILLCFYTISILAAIFFTILKNIFEKNRPHFRMILFDILSIGFIFFCFYKQFFDNNSIFIISDWMRWAMILKLIRGATLPKINYKRSVLNPAQLFIVSFVAIILIGTFLLLLPNSTYNGISIIDALFTATSAVCVTGLVVVDTYSYFTQFGHSIIMILMQAGGLGILTFASYFSYFFKGGATFENQIALSDISSSNKLGQVFTTLRRIIIITVIVETIGALLIYLNTSKDLIPYFWDRVYFSFFHSISSFCNAGFSTLSGGMMKEGVLFNYPLQLVIIALFVFGGLGFPIVINVLRYIKHFIVRYILFFISGKDNYKPWILTLSNKINLITTFSLIAIGTVVIFTKEYNNVLVHHDGLGKFITALFTATTPRSAGLNTIDFNHLQYSSIILIMLLMWIGASPASTGGGIKTSTFAIATLNFISLARGKSKIEIFRREIADISVRRAFATMSLSFIAIGVGVGVVVHFDGHLSLMDVVFECISAYCTVGLSLGITPELSDMSKVAVAVLMFTGRVTMLSILIAIFKKVRMLHYRYPTEEILIN